jgi:hypothetical protein
MDRPTHAYAELDAFFSGLEARLRPYLQQAVGAVAKSQDVRALLKTMAEKLPEQVPAGSPARRHLQLMRGMLNYYHHTGLPQPHPAICLLFVQLCQLQFRRGGQSLAKACERQPSSLSQLQGPQSRNRWSKTGKPSRRKGYWPTP